MYLLCDWLFLRGLVVSANVTSTTARLTDFSFEVGHKLEGVYANHTNNNGSRQVTTPHTSTKHTAGAVKTEWMCHEPILILWILMIVLTMFIH